VSCDLMRTHACAHSHFYCRPISTGASLNIDEFIPYPAHRSERSCVKAFWSLNLEFANATFRDFSGPLAQLLKEGVYVTINHEIMRVVDAGSRAVEGKVAAYDATAAQAAFKVMDANSDDILDMLNESSPFITPEDYRSAWADLPDNAARIDTFYTLLGNITGRTRGEKAGAEVNLSDYIKVFTRFRSRVAVCHPCANGTSPQACSQLITRPCHGIASKYNKFPTLSEGCTSYDLSIADGSEGSCSEARGPLAPCRRNGHITVARRQLNTVAERNGICKMDDPNTQAIIPCPVDKTKRLYSCSCLYGTEEYSLCGSDRDCRSHQPGTALSILPSSMLGQEDATPLIKLPSLGAKHAVLLEIADDRYVAVANHNAGCGARGYAQDSFLYKFDFDSRTYRLHQRLRTQGAHGLATFARQNHDIAGNLQTRTYLLNANMRQEHSLLARSSIYQWTQSGAAAQRPQNCSMLGGIAAVDGGVSVCCPSYCNATCGDRKSCQGSCCTRNATGVAVVKDYQDARLPCVCAEAGRCRFEAAKSPDAMSLVAHVITSAAVKWTVFKSAEPTELSLEYLIPVLSSGVTELAVDLSIYTLENPKPAPVIVMNMPSAIGPCGDVVLDAQSTFGSAGRPFTLVLWQVIDGPITITRDDPLGDLLASTQSLLLNVPFDIAGAGNASGRPYFKSGRWRVELTLGNWIGMNSSYIAVVNKSNAEDVNLALDGILIGSGQSILLCLLSFSAEFQRQATQYLIQPTQ
jgi:hypothetical protein